MTVTVPEIPTPVPQSSDLANFDARADALFTALPGVVAAQNSQNIENNAINANVNAKAQAAATSAANAASSAAGAATSASNAAGASTAATQKAGEASASAGNAAASASAAAASAAGAAAAMVGSLPKTGGVITGDLGLGIQPKVRLHSAGESSGFPVLGESSGGFLISSSNGNYGVYGGVDGATGAAWLQSMRSDSAVAYSLVLNPSGGNVGMGGAPNAWGGSYSGAFQMKLGGGIVNNNANDVHVFNNCYFDGSNWIYITTNPASRFEQFNGGHYWLTAPQGAAGSIVNFMQPMVLDSSGSFRLGTVSDLVSSVRLSVAPGVGGAPAAAFKASNGLYAVQFGNTTGSGIYYPCVFGNNGFSSTVGSISVAGSSTAYNTSSDYRLKNITGPITTSGAYIDSLCPVEGTWKADGSAFVGLIAHEAQEASRTPVATGVKDGPEMQAMDYSSAEIIANMLAELKSLRRRVAALEAA